MSYPNSAMRFVGPFLCRPGEDGVKVARAAAVSTIRTARLGGVGSGTKPATDLPGGSVRTDGFSRSMGRKGYTQRIVSLEIVNGCDAPFRRSGTGVSLSWPSAVRSRGVRVVSISFAMPNQQLRFASRSPNVSVQVAVTDRFHVLLPTPHTFKTV